MGKKKKKKQVNDITSSDMHKYIEYTKVDIDFHLGPGMGSTDT